MRPRASCTPGRGGRRSSLQRRASEGENSGEEPFLHLGNSRSPDPARRCLGEWPPLLVWRKSAAETEMLRAVQGGGCEGGCGGGVGGCSPLDNGGTTTPPTAEGKTWSNVRARFNCLPCDDAPHSAGI